MTVLCGRLGSYIPSSCGTSTRLTAIRISFYCFLRFTTVLIVRANSARDGAGDALPDVNAVLRSSWPDRGRVFVTSACGSDSDQMRQSMKKCTETFVLQKAQTELRKTKESQ